MAEPKRLQFTTVTPSNDEEKKKTPQICHRFTLSLSASTDTTCPEFSYTDLVKSKLKVKKDADKPPSTDETSKTNPFGDDEDADEIAALARKFEEKYGHMDLGEGYDETDEFIDNSEAFDEVLPSYLQTKLGGFYINSGKLDFKEVEDDSREEFKTPVKKKKKKRLITSDSESDEEEKKKKVKKRKIKDGIEGEKKKKKHLPNGDTEKAFKKPKKPIDKEKMKKKKMSPTVAELLKQQTESTSNTPSLTNGVTDTETHSSSMIDCNDSSSEAVITNKEDSNSQDIEEDKKTMDPAAIPKLPAGLTPELEQTIEKLKEEAAKNSSVGKSKFFTSTVNKMLLEVEMGCRQLTCGNRSSVYAYLAVYLPCGKETLKTRAKKLRENMETDLLREPMQKLKEALGKVLPPMIEKYELECQKLAQMRSEEKEKEEQKEDKDSIEDMESGEKTNTETNKKKLPPKKFEWNNEIRVLLCDVVRIKLGIYDSSKTRVQGAEEFLKSFLDREIKTLWPKGWMQTRVLFRECKMAHAPWTMQKPKKTVMVTKTPTAGSAPTTPTSSLISKNVTPNSVTAKTPVNEVSVKQDKSTPSLPVAARSSNIPTILDYAEKDTPQKSSNTTTVSAAKLDTSVTGSQSGSASSGLSLLAASAAKQQYLERSWDHVVSDILRTSLTNPDGKASQAAAKALSAGDSGSSFLAAFEKYASSAAEDKVKSTKVENSGSLVAQQLPTKSGTTQHTNLKSVSEALKQNQNLSASQDAGMQQQKSSVLLQHTKQLHQKQVMDKLKMVSQQNIDNKQTNPNSSLAQQKVVKAIKITPQQQQMIQKVGQLPKSGQAVISVSTSKSGGQHVSLLNQDHIYKQLLESGVQGLGQFKSQSQISPTSAKNTQNVPATIILTSNSGKTLQQKVSPVSLTKVMSGNSISGNSQRPSPGQITSSQISRSSPVSGQRSSQGQIPSSSVSNQRTSPGQISPTVSGQKASHGQISPSASGQRASQGQNLASTMSSQRTPSQVHNQSSSVSLNSVNNKVIYNNSNGQNRNSGTTSNLLQQLFEANSNSSHSVQKQMTSPVVMQRSPQKTSPGPQIWSMSSMATSASNSGKSGGYNMANVIPKPVPGYQSVRIGNISKDLVSPGQLQRTSMHAQGTYGGTPTSPISTGQQNQLGNPRMISGQTSPLRHPTPHELFPPPFTANSLQQQQQQHTVSYPSATYRSYTTEKSRSPHGY